MASLQDIRRRIKSVKSTQQITKAMKMVAAARLRRAQAAAESNVPYATKMREVIADVASSAGGFSHPLLEVRDTGKILYIVLASDKGLAGAYSSNVFKETVAHIKSKHDTSIIAVGRRAKEYFKPRGYDVVQSYTGFTECPEYQNARQIAVDVMEHFSRENYKEVYLVYTHFKSAISAIPQTMKLLPFSKPEVKNADGEKKLATEYIYEPSAEDVLGYLLPQYIITMVYGALLQSAASELSSRMNAMSSATDNAEDLISKLGLHYNKVRQAGITREITEIVGGAEALK